MVHIDTDTIYLPSEYTPPPGSNRRHSESISITKPPKLNDLRRYYKSTYDFSSPKRYKTVIHLEPRLAPVKYYRTVDFGKSVLLRHESGVFCDYRPRPCAYSETAWIFPKQATEIYTSVIQCDQLIDSTWYKSQVNFTQTQTQSQQLAEDVETGSCRDSADSEENSAERRYMMNNNNEKLIASYYNNGRRRCGDSECSDSNVSSDDSIIEMD